MKIVNGTHYHDETSDKLIEELEGARINNSRVKFIYGKYGRRWWDTCSTYGFIGRSTGVKKIPIICPTRKSVGGDAILDNCVVQLFVGHVQVYIDESMKDALNNYEYSIDYSDKFKKFYLNINDGEFISRHSTLTSARRLKDFLIGERLVP